MLPKVEPRWGHPECYTKYLDIALNSELLRHKNVWPSLALSFLLPNLSFYSSESIMWEKANLKLLQLISFPSSLIWNVLFFCCFFSSWTRNDTADGSLICWHNRCNWWKRAFSLVLVTFHWIPYLVSQKKLKYVTVGLCEFLTEINSIIKYLDLWKQERVF